MLKNSFLLLLVLFLVPPKIYCQHILGLTDKRYYSVDAEVTAMSGVNNISYTYKGTKPIHLAKIEIGLKVFNMEIYDLKNRNNIFSLYLKGAQFEEISREVKGKYETVFYIEKGKDISATCIYNKQTGDLDFFSISFRERKVNSVGVETLVRAWCGDIKVLFFI